VAQLYGESVSEFTVPNDLKLKDTANRWRLIKELEPNFDREKIYNRFINEGFKKGDKSSGLFEGLTAEQRLQTYVEKRIKQILEKQGYDGVRYYGGNTTDQAGEYQIFDIKKIKRK
jgi:hypothetical protein